MRITYITLIILLSGCAAQVTKQSPPVSAINKDSPEYYVDSGRSQLSNRNTKKAIQEFDAAIELCKSQYGNNGKQVYASRGAKETAYYMLKASSEKKSAIAVSPTCADALYLKGYAVLDLGDIALAQSLLEQAVSMSPVNSVYLSELGHIHQASRSWDEALQVFIRAEGAAKIYSPDNVKEQELARAKRGVGYSLIELGRLDEAESKFKECLIINKNDEVAKQEQEYIEQLRNNGQSNF